MLIELRPLLVLVAVVVVLLAVARVVETPRGHLYELGTGADGGPIQLPEVVVLPLEVDGIVLREDRDGAPTAGLNNEVCALEVVIELQPVQLADGDCLQMLNVLGMVGPQALSLLLQVLCVGGEHQEPGARVPVPALFGGVDGPLPLAAFTKVKCPVPRPWRLSVVRDGARCSASEGDDEGPARPVHQGPSTVGRCRHAGRPETAVRRPLREGHRRRA
mmetsp:Transcript_91942/g.265241  ORF Transcript_91942/g.265241 Transcript_91942/m.265241 type:complete len:218 (+) Transcript_91942:1430-2083(+)